MCIIAESMQHILHSSPYNAYMYQFRVYLTDKIKYEKRNTQVWWPVPHATESVSISEARSLKYTHTTGEVEGSERERTCLHFALLVFVGAGQLLSRVGRGLGIVWEEELGEAILVPRVCRGSVRVWRVGACTQYIYTYKLLSSISGFRSKNTTYGALASRLRSASSTNTTYGALASGLRSVSSIKRETKEQVDFSRKYSETKRISLKEARLEGDCMTNTSYLNEPSTAWGPPYTGGPGQTAPVAPPCRRHWL